LQTRRGTDWQSEHRKQAQQHDSELDTVCPFDETQDLHWLRKTPSTLAQFASTARSLANHEASGSVQSATTHSLVAHGNLSHVHLMRTTEFYDDPWKALQPPTWHSSLNKPLWTTNVHWLLAKSLKKSEACECGEYREFKMDSYP
tara:strand:+ start:353 stop:787 length:435 start_codon:yes stop_codon:yes gene_type:complete